ncbi:unnamed protein product [Linum trigynum]|uniref:KIB1-4 beta-propeller domain-containing protein n=1 Tax=Linum trigynum TaxID=586398 RepID=A0AAV2CNV7_9ROSI
MGAADPESEQQGRLGESTPLLMLPHCSSTRMISGNCDSGSDRYCCFYDVANRRFHHIHGGGGGGNPSVVVCRGSAFGWLFMVHQIPSIFLLNPLTGSQIPLPPITSFPDVLDYNPQRRNFEFVHRLDGEQRLVVQGRTFFQERFFRKTAVSAEPTAEDCVVMAIRFNNNYRLAFCRPGGDEWSLVPNPEEEEKIPFMDVVFWKGKFYAVDCCGRVVVADLSLLHRPKLSFHLNLAPRDFVNSEHPYLIPSPDEGGDRLMMVTRYMQLVAASPRGYRTVKFNVYKLDDEDRKGWDEVASIGDFAIFVGFNSAFSVSTRDHSGLISNSIYFTDDFIDWHQRHKLGGHDMGVYSLNTRAVKPLYSTSSLHANPLLISPLPVWILPSN